jgi:hypothetical protein
VYRNTVNNSATAYWLAFNGDPNLTSFEDTTAVPGTTYYYWVRALTWASTDYLYSDFSASDTGYAATTLSHDAAPIAHAVDQLDLEALVAAELAGRSRAAFSS